MSVDNRWPGLPTFVLGIILLAWSLFMDLTTHLVPPGRIIDLELAKSGADISSAICNGSQRINEAAVRWNTTLDFILITTYTALLCILSLQNLRNGVRSLAVLGALSAMMAGVFDVLENFAIFRALGSTATCVFGNDVALAISHPSWAKWSLLSSAMALMGSRLMLTHRESVLLRLAGIVFGLSGIIGVAMLQFRKPEISVLGLGIGVLLVLTKFVTDRVHVAGSA